MSETYEELVGLAQAAGFKKQKLTKADKKLLGSVANGESVDCAEDEDRDDRVVSSKLLEWLLTSPAGAPLLDRRGVQLVHAIFPEAIDLSEAEVNVPIRLHECEFENGVLMQNARTRTLSFQGSTLRCGDSQNALKLDGAHIQGSLFLRANDRKPMEIEGCILLMGVRISGNFEAIGAKIKGKVKSSDDGVVIRETDVIIADRARVDGGFFLDGAEIEGNVGLGGISILSDLNISKAKIKIEKGRVISADDLTVNGTVFLRGSEVQGCIDLTKADIGKNFRLEQSVIRCGKESEFAKTAGALSLHGASVGGSLAFYYNYDEEDAAKTAAKIDGMVNLRDAKVGVLDDCEVVWKKHLGDPGEGAIPALDGFVYKTLGRNSPKHSNFRIRWLELGKDAGNSFAPQPYSQLAKVLRETGHPQWAKKILIEREKRQLNEIDDTYWRKGFRRVFVEWLLGHGYRSWRVCLPMLALLLIGRLIFLQGWEDEEIVPSTPLVFASFKTTTTQDSDTGAISTDETQRFPSPYTTLTDEESGDLKEYPAFNSLLYSADTLLPIIDLHQESYWLPKGWYRYYMWAQIILGWVLTTMFVAGFTGVVRRPAE